jgi:hypothetical protein
VECPSKAVVGPGFRKFRPEKFGKKTPLVGLPRLHGQKGEKSQGFLEEPDGFPVPENPRRTEESEIEHKGSRLFFWPVIPQRLTIGAGMRGNGRTELLDNHRSDADDNQ